MCTLLDVLELHHFDLQRLKRKVAEGKYEDKERAHRTFKGHDLGVYKVKMKPGKHFYIYFVYTSFYLFKYKA